MRAAAATLITAVRTISEALSARTLSTFVHTTMSNQPRVFHSRLTADGLKGPCYTVITYNLLAQKYINAGAHHYCPAEHRTWQSRWDRIQTELQQYDADLLSLQEVEEPVFSAQLMPLLAQHQMQGIYRPRQHGGSGPPEGEAFFFRTSCFELLKSRCIRFGDHVAETGPFWQEVQRREEGAVITLLKCKATGQTILAGSVHLYFHPEWPDIKLAQAALLCGQAADMIKAEGLQVDDTPVMLGGDWNSLWLKYTPDVYDPEIPLGYLSSGVYALLSSEQGVVDSSHHEHPATRHHAYKDLGELEFDTSQLKLHSAYAAGNDSQEPPLTTQTNSFMGCLDYIWLSQKHWQVTSTLSMPYDVQKGPQPQTVGFRPIPDKEFPSDHLAVGCQVILKS